MKIIKLSEQQVSNALILLDKVTTTGINEAIVLVDLVQNLKSAPSDDEV